MQDNLDKNGPEIYRQILHNFVRLLLAQGRRVVIVPQYFRPADPDEPRFFKVAEQGIYEHNLVNQELAAMYNLDFVGSVLSPDGFEHDDTVDIVHFNQNGSRKMAEIVYRNLMENGVVR